MTVRAEGGSVVLAHEDVSFDQVAEEQLPRVERLLLRILGPRTDMEDLVQTVFLELLRALPARRGGSELSTFVGGIAVNVARRAMRPSAYARKRGPMPAEPIDAGADPERLATARRRMARVRTALEHVRPKKRIAFCLWALEGMDVPEIAATMGASEAATRSRIWHAQKELRARAERDPELAEALGGDS